MQKWQEILNSQKISDLDPTYLILWWLTKSWNFLLPTSLLLSTQFVNGQKGSIKKLFEGFYNFHPNVHARPQHVAAVDIDAVSIAATFDVRTWLSQSIYRCCPYLSNALHDGCPKQIHYRPLIMSQWVGNTQVTPRKNLKLEIEIQVSSISESSG